MPEPIIRVENLGKKYLIRHQAGGPRYRALRDVLTDGVKTGFGLFKRTSNAPTREEFWALKDVSFEVNEGEVVGIIGRNGAGKSTLLKILSRITEPTAGRVTLDGRVASLLEVGTGFHPELTGRENIYLNGSILGMSRAEIARKFDEIVAFAEVEKFLDTPVKRYSSGMYVRLAFAVAAHLEPEILVVDEVLAVGDAEFQKKCLGKMSEVARGGRTVLFVSHSMPSVQRLCQRALLIHSGQLVGDGLTCDVINRYTASGSVTTNERIWQGGMPGNDHPRVQLISAQVVGANGLSASVLDITRPFTIEVEYRSELTDARPTAILNFFNDQDVCLFASNEFTAPDWQHKPLGPRLCRTRCHIPGNTLAEGTVSVTIAVGSYNPNVVYCLERDALNFQVVDESEGRGVRGPHVGDWPGVVRPMLQWDIHVA